MHRDSSPAWASLGHHPPHRPPPPCAQEVEEADESGLIMFASLPKDMVLEMVGQLWGLHMLDVDPLMPRQHRDLHPIDLPEGLDSLARASGGEAVPAPSRSASRRDCLPAAGRLIGRCFSA